MKPKPFVPEILKDRPSYVRDRTEGQIWHRCVSRVLYADTDRSQVVYHANYLRYFELGRASLMRDAAYPYREIEESGYIYPIIQVELSYYSPLRYDDGMFIHTRPSELERVKLRFDYVITNEQNGDIVCRGFTRHCATNSSGIPVGVDEKTLLLWKNFPQ
ncbi:MAG: acyl-CoA thioesterase [Desulfococcaceae bacterium]